MYIIIGRKTISNIHKYTSTDNFYAEEKRNLLKTDLQEAAAKIQALEEKLEILETRIPKKYPEVKFLNYLKKKRILVC